MTLRQRLLVGAQMVVISALSAGLLVGCSSAKKHEDSTVSTTALDLLAPISGNGAYAADARLAKAAFRYDQKAWEECVRAQGADPDLVAGFELYSLNKMRAAFPSVSFGREHSTFGRLSSSSVRNLSAAQTDAFSNCGQMSPKGGPTDKIGELLEGTVALSHQEVALSAGSGADWADAKRCLMDQGADASIVDSYANSVRFADPTNIDVTAEQQVEAGRERFQAWDRCTASFRRNWEKKLKAHRDDLLDTNREAFVKATALLESIGVKG